jgi:NADH:ubiquinone oxidoreductase subunit C
MFLQKIDQFKNIFPLISCQIIKREIIFLISPINNLFSLKLLKSHINFKLDILSCITGIDLLLENYRFCIVYELLSTLFNSKIRLKIFINEIESVTSSIFIFINANWWEREIWDLFGIYFYKHTDLRRILTDYGFEGYPMRKDFPLSGYVEFRYNELKKKIVSDRVQLTQEFRVFSFSSPWK